MSTTTSQQFEGSTIEEALEAAVATLGDDLEIIDAQRVSRRGVLGVGRRERYEVTAARKARQADAFDSVLERMVDRVDRAEQRLGGVDLADTDFTWWREADFVLPAPTQSPRSRSRPVESQPTVGVSRSRSTPGLAEGLPAVSTSPLGPDAASAAPALGHGGPARAEPPRRPPAHAAAPISDSGPDEAASIEWSKEALVEIGLPPALVGRIPDDLRSDLDWVAAVARAMEELLDTAAGVSGPCELTGHGQHAVVQLVRGACEGFRIGHLVIDGERVPATPMELALAVRAVVRDR